MSELDAVDGWKGYRSIPEGDFFDDFKGETYSFTNGGDSPNGNWTNKFLAGGTSGVRKVSGVGNVMYQISTAPTQAENTFSIVNYISSDLFEDFDMTARMRTIQQLRTGSSPNSWESAWLIWRSGNISGQGGYYFVIKTNGVEFGKSDNIDTSISNHTLAGDSTPTLTLGQWYTVRVKVQGNRHQVWVDGVLKIDYEDLDYGATSPASRIIQGPGYISFYNEDAEVELDYITIKKLPIVDIVNNPHSTPKPVVSNRKVGTYNGHSDTVGEGLLSGILTVNGSGGSTSSVVDDLGIRRGFTTVATEDEQKGLATSSAIFRRSHNIKLNGKFHMPASATNTQFWFGVASTSTIDTTANPLNTIHGYLVGFRADTGIWGIISNNGQTTNAVTAEGLAVAGGQWVLIQIELLSNGKSFCKINNRTPIEFTSAIGMPSAATNLFIHAMVQNVNGSSARTLEIDSIDIELSPGIIT